jgi:hypothetical protein
MCGAVVSSGAAYGPRVYIFSRRAKTGEAGLRALHHFFVCGRDDWMQGSAPCTAVVFLLAQKDDRKMRQAFPLHSLCSASAMTLLMLKLRIVYRRIVHTPVSAPLGADLLSFRAKRGISHSEACAIVDGDSSALSRLRMTGSILSLRVCTDNSHTSMRGARNRRSHYANTSDMHSGNDKRLGLSTRKADYKGGSPCFLFSSFFKSEKGPRGAGTESPRSRPRRARWRRRLAAGLRALHLVTFRSCGKSPKARQGFPLHSLCSASAMTLLMLKLRIVHRRIVHTPVSAPLGADLLSFRAKRGISHSEACAIVDGDSSALTRLRMTGGRGRNHRALVRAKKT